MNDQERQIIADIFKRLEGVKDQPRDADAERFIADKLRAQPYAPYAMAQALYVQEEALKSLNQQMDELRAENEQLQSRGSGGGGILSSIFGGGASSRPEPGQFSRTGAAGGQHGYGQGGQQGGYGPQGGPWGGQQGGPQQGGPWGGQQQPAAGGGFLRGALTTAAGVAGGMVVGSALMNAFSGGGHSSLGSFSNTDMASMGAPLGGGAGGVQDASFSDGGNSFTDSGFGGGSGVQDASFDDGGGVDFGGGDDSWT